LTPDDLVAKSKAAKDEAETLAAIICQASPEDRSTETLKLTMRNRMVEKISKITIDLEAKAHRGEEETLKFPTLHKGKEVWIYFSKNEKGPTRYAADLIGREGGPTVAARLMQKNPNVWYMRPASSVKAIEELEKQILNGDFDERLGTDPAKLIFDALKDTAVDQVTSQNEDVRPSFAAKPKKVRS